ncbi:MAG: inorganic diphosphatase [Rhodospirillaceae bacterium]
MNIEQIPVGENPPYDVNVIIEIPMGGNPVKYEIDKKSGAMYVDRFLHTAIYYPCNYGFIPHTLSDDGDPTDAAVLGQIPVIPGVPVDDLHPFYGDVGSYRDIRPIMLEQIQHFFEHYKDLEPGKWVKVQRWGEAEEAMELIRAANRREADRVTEADRTYRDSIFTDG